MLKHVPRLQQAQPLDRALDLVCLTSRRTQPVALLSTLVGAAPTELAAALAQHAPEVRKLLRLVPPPGATPGWHRDAWRALPADERATVAVVVGPTALQ